MNIDVMVIALFVVSVLSSLTVQGIKKLIGDREYSANILVVVVSLILSVLVTMVYIIMTGTQITLVLITEAVVLVYLSFLVATNGYDKVIQTLKQIKEVIQ